MIEGNNFLGLNVFVGWDLGSPEGDQTVYMVSERRGEQIVTLYIGPDKAYAEALAEQRGLCPRRPHLTVLQGGKK